MLEPWLDDGDLRLYHGDALSVLEQLPAGIAQTCVTSPPYWGLRDYGTGQWTGGDETCDHKTTTRDRAAEVVDRPYDPGSNFANYAAGYESGDTFKQVCGRCGALRVDSQLGLEATPTQYVTNMVNLFREVWRVLRDDGSLWLNLGDSYAGGGGYSPGSPSNVARQEALADGVTQDGAFGVRAEANYTARRKPSPGDLGGLKPKDLVGIPWRVAFALQADGWYLRSDIIWSKPNPMPESVTDRPTKAHEYLFLFSKQPRYFYDADAIREPHGSEWIGRTPVVDLKVNGDRADGGAMATTGNPAGRNRRSVWTIPTQPFPEAHFATYPEELVRPCILAGTSERGECVECGAPWRRLVERTPIPNSGSGHQGYRTYGNATVGMVGSSDNPRFNWSTETTGWTPSCACRLPEKPAPTRPQLVLDPFIGSGTTSLVARKHGRRSIGIDLSAEYLQIAAQRTRQLSLLGGSGC